MYTEEQKNLFNASWRELVNNGVVTTKGWVYCESLADVVAHRYYLHRDPEEMKSLAMIAAVEFLPVVEANTLSGAYPEPKCIRNILFSKMRNSISNYLYHHRKEVLLGLKPADDGASYDPEYEIDSVWRSSWGSIEEGVEDSGAKKVFCFTCL